MASVACLGFAAGALHALTGPDHMAVLLPSCIGRPASRAWKTGARWGLGHGLGATGFGALAVTVKRLLRLDIAAASHWLELGLALTLVFIGANGMRETGADGAAAVRRLVRETELAERGERSAEDRTGAGAAEREFFIDKHGKLSPMTLDQLDGREAFPSERASGNSGGGAAAAATPELSGAAAVATGILHGFTGTGHLVGVLPALGMASAAGAAVYLSGFCAGTLVAMAAFTAMVGELSVRLQRTVGPGALVHIGRVASVFAIAMGVVIFVRWCTVTDAVSTPAV